MIKFAKKFLGVAILALAGFAAPAMATPTYLGSWQVDQGPSWGIVPPAYSGLAAAVLLFSSITGDTNPNDYAISTVSSDPTKINNAAWYSVWGSNNSYTGPAPLQSFGVYGLVLPDNYTNDTVYANPGDVSTYVQDWATGSTFTNYAFYLGVTNVPEPASLALAAIGLVGLSLARKRSNSKAV